MNRGRRGTVYIFSCALCGVIIFSCFNFEIPTDILLLREHFPWLDHFFLRNMSGMEREFLLLFFIRWCDV